MEQTWGKMATTMTQSIFNEVFQYEGIRQTIFAFKGDTNLIAKKKKINHILERLIACNIPDDYEGNYIGFAENIRVALRRMDYYVSTSYVIDFITDKFKHISSDVNAEPQGICIDGENIIRDYTNYVSFKYDDEYSQVISWYLLHDLIEESFGTVGLFYVIERLGTEDPLSLDDMNILIEHKNSTALQITDEQLFEAIEVHCVCGCAKYDL